MIGIFHQDERLADVEVLDGRLRIVSYAGDWVATTLLRMREHGMTDQELYDSLPECMQGRVWAGVRILD